MPETGEGAPKHGIRPQQIQQRETSGGTQVPSEPVKSKGAGSFQSEAPRRPEPERGEDEGLNEYARRLKAFRKGENSPKEDPSKK